MAGIGTPAPAPSQAAPASEATETPMRDVSAPDAEEPNVSPEEQKQYDQFVGNAQKIIYVDGKDGKPTVSSVVLAHLNGQFEPELQQVFEKADPPLGGTPTDNLAAATIAIVLVLENSAAAGNAQVEDAIVMHGGAEILGDLADVAKAAKIYDYSEKDVETATYRAFDLYRVTSGRVDPDQLKQQFGEIAQADKAGNLDKLLPGIGARMKQQAS